MPYVPLTRTVEISHDPKDPRRPWIAVDHRTRAPVIRLADRDPDGLGLIGPLTAPLRHPRRSARARRW